jgi:hypothetical protein
VNLRSEKGHHSIDNSQLKAHKGELTVAGQQRGNQLHVTERRHGPHFCADLLPEKFPELFAQSVHREALAGREEELHDRLGCDLPHLFSLLSNLTHGKRKLRVQPEVADQ